MAILSPSHCYVDGHPVAAGEPGITAFIEERAVGRLCEGEALNEEYLRQFAAAVVAQVEPTRMSTVQWTITVRSASRPQLDESANRIFSTLIARHGDGLAAPRSAAVRDFLVIPGNGATPADLVEG